MHGWLLLLFIAAFMVPVYSYFIYPVVLYVLSRIVNRRFVRDCNHVPMVTLLISAYNEALVIKEKMENSLALDYPRERLQIIVVNDGSTDETDAIVADYARHGILHHRVEGRQGKNEAINHAWPLVRGELVVFSDANSMYDRNAIRRLAAHFADSRVGCVCGELRYVGAHTGSAAGEDLYWRYEQYLKKLQSRIGEVLVLNGSIFAVRHELFVPLQPKIANDFQIPVAVAAAGYAVIYEPDAVAFEKVAVRARDEFERKARIVARGFEGFVQEIRGVRGLRLFQIISHKFLRWNVWLALLVMFFSNMFLLDNLLLRCMFAGQIVFYALACCGPLLTRFKVPGLAIPYYFGLVNLGALEGFWRFIRRQQPPEWDPPRSGR